MLDRNASICIVQLRCVGHFLCEVWNSSVTKSSYEVELCKMTTHFALVTRQLAYKFFFRVTNATLSIIKVRFELLTRIFNFFSKLLTLI